MCSMYKMEQKNLKDFNSISDESARSLNDSERSTLKDMTPKARDAFRKRTKILVCILSAACLVLLNVIGALIFLGVEKYSKKDSGYEFGHSECIKNVEKELSKNPDSLKVVSFLDECLKRNSEINSFSKAFFYSWTLYSTVGYGNYYPHTTAGRTVTIIYSMLVVPIYIAFKFEVGTYIAYFLLFIANQIVTYFRKSYIKICEKLEECDVEIKISKDYLIFTSAVVACAICVLVSSTYFSICENLTYASSVYFGIITMSLIGLGDVTPGKIGHFMFGYICFFLVADILSNHIFYFLQGRFRRLFHAVSRFLLIRQDSAQNSDQKAEISMQNMPIITTQCMPMNVMDCEQAEIRKDEQLITPGGSRVTMSFSEGLDLSIISSPLATSTPKVLK